MGQRRSVGAALAALGVGGRRGAMGRRRRPTVGAALALAVGVLVAAVAMGPVGPVLAKPLPDPPPTVPGPTLPPRTDPTTTTTRPPIQVPVPTVAPVPVTSPPAQTTVAPQPGPGDEDTTTTSPPGSPSDLPPPVGDGGDAGGDGGATGPLPRLGDDSVALILDDIQRSGASSTAALLDALRPLTALGFSEQETFMSGMGRFPVAGLATWTDDFHDPRYNPEPHLHQGTDIWSAFGTPVKSPADGVLQLTDEVVGGKSAYVTTSDGTWYYMTHLGGFAPDVSSGDTVAVGRLLAFNGDTGNAAGGPPHVHFEIHPGGGGAVNPKPILDQWVADALAAVPVLVGEHRDSNPRVMLTTGELRRFDVPADGTSERAAKSQLLWSASVTSGGAVLRLAEVEAARMAARVDWNRRALQAQAVAVQRHQAQQRASNLLSRLTPAELLPVLEGASG